MLCHLLTSGVGSSERSIQQTFCRAENAELPPSENNHLKKELSRDIRSRDHARPSTYIRGTRFKETGKASKVQERNNPHLENTRKTSQPSLPYVPRPEEAGKETRWEAESKGDFRPLLPWKTFSLGGALPRKRAKDARMDRS